MASVSAARRYAQAIMEMATEHDDFAAWRTDLDQLAAVWAEPVIRGYLEDVRISKQKRLDRARQTLESRIGPLPLNMVLLLLSRNRSNLIPYIVREFDELERRRERIVLVRVTSAQPLAPDQRAALIAQLQRQTGNEISLEEVVDPRIMGGLVVRVGDQLLDLSVAGKLRQLREQVVGRAASRN